MYLSQDLCCLSLGLYRPCVCLPHSQCGLPCAVYYNKDYFGYSTSPACHPPVSPWSEFPSTLPPASKAHNPPRPVDLSSPPWLLAPSSPPWPISPLARPGSLIPQDPPWSGVEQPAPRNLTTPAAPRPSSSVRLLHSLGSSLVLCRSGSITALWIPASVAGTA